MRAEIIRGKLLAVDGNRLTIAHEESPDGDHYDVKDIEIDERWIRTWLGEWADWVIIDGVVQEVKNP